MGSENIALVGDIGSVESVRVRGDRNVKENIARQCIYQ